MANTNPARGTRDFLPTDVRKREYVIGVIKQVYGSYGFEPLETPAVENIETLMGKYGEEGNQLIFKILKRGEKVRGVLGSGSEVREQDLVDLALRYDLTVPLARVVADRRNDLPKFFKRYQIQPVWRADRPARGRFREFYQCDVDAIGSTSVTVEVEIITAVTGILRRLGFNDFTVRVNHRQLLTSMLNAAGVVTGMHSDALIALDKLDKIGPAGVAKEFLERGIPGGESLLELFSSFKEKNDADKSRLLGDFVGSDGVGQSAITELSKIIDLGPKEVTLDASLARGLSYYTGTIIEINVPDLMGSLGGGGRYDALIGMFGKEQIPACGFSLGLERILVVMDERGMFPPEVADSSPADVMITLWSEETAGESLELASELRSSGLRVTVYPEGDKFGKQIKYADTTRIPFVCIMGDTELAEGKVTIKNLITGAQETVDRSDAASSIRSS